MNLLESKKIIYTAQSKKFFFAKMFVCKFVLEKNAIPLNPFNVWGYFLNELADRDLVRRGNNNIVRISDETWVFGPIADGVLFEIDYAISLNKKIKFFSIGSKFESIKPLNIDDLHFEPKALKNETKEQIIVRLKEYMSSVKDVK